MALHGPKLAKGTEFAITSFRQQTVSRSRSGCNRLRRYTLRLDGFVSVSAGWKGGQLLTRPVMFDGDRLEINFATSAAGSLRVEIQDLDGAPVEGFALTDCTELFGDSVSRRVTWSSDADLSALVGKPVRLRFELKDADLYSFRFATHQ